MAPKTKELLIAQGLKKRSPRKIKNERKRTLIVCEGTQTEPQYFKDMVRDLKISNMDVVIRPGKHSNPTAVVNTAIEIYEGDRTFEVIYCLIDTDEFGANISAAERLIKTHQFSKRKKDSLGSRIPEVKIIRSNPCIEVWFILHYEKLRHCFKKNNKTAALNCKDYLRGKYILEYNENYKGLYSLIKSLGKKALVNEKELHDWIKQEKLDNPWSQVGIIYSDLHGLVYSPLKKS
ncbi:RloB family protein [Yersinia enterocolitica]|uniref:RloB family protein n=3 Tax=Yersinia enterocolitica TaxID=630 RepID=UPI0005E95108|nr:RloB family protein [Yersinia enterocolitica]EKN4861456.1 RloB domain-containing protein [Yersinia enterocolitica]EKN6244579.1 RloB domain-containing protein [Yersinia enterocolitica]EKN6363140.1 RloB domain-containing protein [Yersinia enterocolitica]EKN6372930.1 RloB domain-containing protein [Yersinia enterocolitica]ELI8338181.1 RloB domain-containing protein [Yersinia enterocolitica]